MMPPEGMATMTPDAGLQLNETVRHAAGLMSGMRAAAPHESGSGTKRTYRLRCAMSALRAKRKHMLALRFSGFDPEGDIAVSGADRDAQQKSTCAMRIRAQIPR